MCAGRKDAALARGRISSEIIIGSFLKAIAMAIDGVVGGKIGERQTSGPNANSRSEFLMESRYRRVTSTREESQELPLTCQIYF